MTRVTHYGHGVYCRRCQEVYDGTDGCDHDLYDKDGVQRTHNGYEAIPADKGHHSPCKYIKIDGMDTCIECDAVKIPGRMVTGNDA